MTQHTVSVLAPGEQFALWCYSRWKWLFGVNVNKNPVLDGLRQTGIRLWAETELTISAETPGPGMSLGLGLVEEGGGEEEGGGDSEGREGLPAEHVDYVCINCGIKNKNTQTGNRTPILGFKVRCPNRWTI